MSSLRVLNDACVHDILINLPKDGILQLRDTLLECLINVSNGSERDFQPSVGVVNRPEGQKCLFRPFSSPEYFGTKIVVTPAPSSKAAGALHGVITLCDKDGFPTGIINAEEVTGYRTSLCALIPYIWRRYTDRIVVFGAGKQALWHLRIAIALRGNEIKSITVVNRSEQRAQHMIDRINEENKKRWKSSAEIEYLNPSRSDYDTILQGRLGIADAIFCTVGSTSPLFPAHFITNRSNTERYPFISAVGSWQPDMIELDPQLLLHAAGHVDKDFCWKGNSTGAVLVDDRQAALLHSGEIVRSRLQGDNLVEVGEIEILQKQANNAELSKWVKEGLVVYKNIGVSTTDLAIGTALLAIAAGEGIGVLVNDF
ncbi:proline utilization protein [Colletotrichum truncatum]|uniref:Proline utilization protein n=1 Tax=Colletotrichum truncatum TaxID=5467 RepID=A0ACC3YUG8_COLTU|nr:proline utilization protein [Colletotrichum truncatum]KAF6781089.1 proline utilization protein [Colletotrichum truncatum]